MSMLLSSFLGTGIGFGTATALSPLMELASQQLYKILPTKIYDPSTAALAFQRREITAENYFEIMQRTGFTLDGAVKFFKATRQIVDVQAIIFRYRHKDITEQQAFSEAEESGYSVEDFKKLLDATVLTFTPQDLIRFLVREVFTPEIRKKFQQDEEFPVAAIEQAAKIGMSEALLKDYWAAHWELPSIEEGYEMYFRFRPEDRKFWEKEITDLKLNPDDVQTDLESLVTLQRTKDLMPFWRSKQLAIAFRPLTLRMLQQQVRLRILDYENTLYQYKKIGYSNRDAERNTWFALINESLGDWIDLLKKGNITEPQIKSEMDEWRVPKSIQDLIWTRKLEPHTEDQITKEKEVASSILKKAFIADKINRDQAVQGLILLKYAEKAAKFTVEIWELDRKQTKVTNKDLTKTDLFKSFDNGVRTEASLKEGLIGIKYSPEEADELILTHKLVKQLKEAKA